MRILKLIRVDRDRKTDRSRIYFRDKYGQIRFLDLEEIWTEHAALELLAEIERLFLSHDKSRDY